MNPTKPFPNDIQLDAALASDIDAIVPSSGFVNSVMMAVHGQAAAPAPIAFPWKRAVPGLIAAAAVAALLIVWIFALLRAPAGANHLLSIVDWPAILAPVLRHASDARWVALTLAVSLVPLLFCRRLVSSS